MSHFMSSWGQIYSMTWIYIYSLCHVDKVLRIFPFMASVFPSRLEFSPLPSWDNSAEWES